MVTITTLALPFSFLFKSKGSGEYALPYLLAPGAYARSPVINRIQDVGRQILKPATENSPALRETGFPIVFMYGENDWMDADFEVVASWRVERSLIEREVVITAIEPEAVRTQI